MRFVLLGWVDHLAASAARRPQLQCSAVRFRVVRPHLDDSTARIFRIRTQRRIANDFAVFFPHPTTQNTFASG